MKNKPLRKTVAFAEGSDNSKLMDKMEALITKIDSHFNEIKGEMKEMRDGCNSCGGSHPLTGCDDKPMGGSKEERDRQPRDDNRNSPLREDNSPIPPTTEKKSKESNFEKTMREFMVAQKSSNNFVKNQFFNLKTQVELGKKNHQAAIQDLETKFGHLSDQCSARPTGSIPSNTQTNPKPTPSNDRPYRPPSAQNEHVNVVFTCSGKMYNPPANPNATIINNDDKDEVDKTKKEEEPSSPKQTKIDLPPLKINVPLIDVLAGMPNYGKFLKDLVSNKSKMEQISAAFLNKECSTIIQNKFPPKLGDSRSFLIPCTFVNWVECLALADLGASINLMPYSLYVSLSENYLKPTKMSILLANHTYQYPMGIAENMLVQVGKFIFPIDFVILQMKEDDKVPLILGRPFLHTANAIIQVKNKELNLEVGDDRITFLINKAMQHCYSNDDTCFRMDVIDEVIEEELDALLDDYNPFLSTSEKINETSLDREFKEFMVVDIKEIPE
ncbi:reverse transcriptase domain-containing protein [Tanacetum coccineum]|uniref:Reverse transcriptase domain-containing protein n=1 Tax=Tanacetum coccineum TaxID=301880 RepID=A0ABQ4Y710_9ASTR